MKQDTLIIEQGALYPDFMRILFFVVGVMLLIVIIGIPILAVSMLYTGTEIDPEHKRIREYYSVLGVRWGKWMPLTEFSSVTVLRVNRSSTMYSRSQQAQDFNEVNHDVVLLNATHRRKQVLKACNTHEEAMNLARIVAERTGFRLEQYAPQPIAPRRR